MTPPLLSLFTPTNNPAYLLDAYQSLLAQKQPVPFEWVIVSNGGVTAAAIPEQIRQDTRVRIVPTDIQRSIGALKRFACQNCTGDVLVEFDHDDWLASDAFTALAQAYERAPAGFFYSDFVNVRPNGSCETFPTIYGWEAYLCEVDGKEYTAVRAFPPSARSMAEIYYAPNHVRAWTRAAYEQAGGHDPKLEVADDHDLICRTWLARAPFVWIQRPIYIYRRGQQNNFAPRVKEIGELQQQNRNKYLYGLVEEEARRRQLRMIDVGRVSSPAGDRAVFQPLDLCSNGFDLSGVLDDSVGVFRCFDFWQRVPRDKIVPLMNELYRKLAPGGWLLTATPSLDDGTGQVGRGAFQDPSYVSVWSENNFRYFTNRRFSTLVPGYRAAFQEVRLWTSYPTEQHRQSRIPYVFCDMAALKGQRQPGPKSF
jgi:glycosyltransferase involved in cell wall biosynthesis